MRFEAVPLYRGGGGASSAPPDGGGDRPGAAERVVGGYAVGGDPLLALRGAATGRVSRGWNSPPVSVLMLPTKVRVVISVEWGKHGISTTTLCIVWCYGANIVDFPINFIQ